MNVDITPMKVLPWILFALTLLGYIWTASSINSKLDYLLERDAEERIFLLGQMNSRYLKVSPSPVPTVLDTLP